MRSRILTATHPGRILEVSRRRYEPGYRQAPHSHDYDGMGSGSVVEFAIPPGAKLATGLKFLDAEFTRSGS